MKKLKISGAARQEFFVDVEDFTLRFDLRFFPMTTSWTLTLDRGETRIVSNRKLSLGNFILSVNNQPYDIALVDNLNTGIDPFKQDDFSEDRVSFYLLNREETAEIRGFEVE